MLVAERSALFLWRNLEERFWSCNLLLIYASFWSLSVMFLYMVNFSCNFQIKRYFLFLGHCHVTFLFWWGCTKNINFLFFRYICSENDSPVRWQLYCYKRYPILRHIFQESPFFCVNTYEKYVVSKKYCIARHDDKMCFPHIFRNNFILVGEIKVLLQKLDALCFNYQHVGCLYALFKYRFSGKIVVKSRQLFHNVQRAVHVNHQNRGADRIPSIGKKRFLKMKNSKIFWAPSKRLNRRKLVDQSLQTELKKLTCLVFSQSKSGFQPLNPSQNLWKMKGKRVYICLI